MSDDGKKKDAGRFSVLFFVVLIVAGYFAWQHYKKTPETAEEAVERTVSAAPLIEREAEVEKNYIGYVMPVHDVSVRPYISGFVDEIRVKGGSEVKAGDVAGEVNGLPMRCTIDGVVRGILPEGTPVHQGMKSGDVDPRCRPEYCTTASDKALAVGGGVLEAILNLSGALHAETTRL